MALLVLSVLTFTMRWKQQQLNTLRFEVDINSRDSLIEIILWYQKTSSMIFGEKILR